MHAHDIGVVSSSTKLRNRTEHADARGDATKHPELGLEIYKVERHCERTHDDSGARVIRHQPEPVDAI